MIKSLAAFQNQAFFNCNYELFVAKDDNIAIYRYSYADCKWSKEREGEFKFSPDAVAAFQNSKNLNYEWFTVKDNRLQHWWIESNPKERYRDFFLGAVIGNASGGVAAFQNHAAGNLNYEVFAVQNGHLRHWWRDWYTGEWHPGARIGDASGGVAAFQNHAPGNLNYEVFAVQNGHLRHWWRDWCTGEWHPGARIGDASGGVAAFQNHAPDNLNYEVFAVQNGHVRHWWRDWNTGEWHPGARIGDASGGVAAFQNHAPDNLNYEVFAVQNGDLRHWWRDWYTGQWYLEVLDIDPV